MRVLQITPQRNPNFSVMVSHFQLGFPRVRSFLLPSSIIPIDRSFCHPYIQNLRARSSTKRTRHINGTFLLLQMIDWLICTQIVLLISSNSCFLLIFRTHSIPQLDITYSSLSRMLLASDKVSIDKFTLTMPIANTGRNIT